MQTLKDIICDNLFYYERHNGDIGVVFANTREEALAKLQSVYPDTLKRVEATDKRNIDYYEEMYVTSLKNAYPKSDSVAVLVPGQEIHFY